MKHLPTIMLLALFVLALLPIGVAQTSPTSNPVQVALLSYQPVPATPGDTLEVQLSVRNQATSSAQGVEIEVLSQGVFTTEGRTNIGIGTIPAQNSFTARFTVRVESTAEAGDRALQVRTRQQGQDWQQSTIFIPVVSQQSAVLITDVTSNNLIPGETGTLTLTVENLADTTLRDIVVQPDLTQTPFRVTQTATQQRIATLAPGQVRTVTYQLNTQATAQADDYAIPLTMRFLDSAGNQKESMDTISVRVTSEPRTLAYVDLVERQNGDAIVRLRIVNTGLSEIKFVQATVQDAEGYTVHPQSQQVYVGNINSDDWETVRFTITPTQDALTVPITYTFMDAFNQEHTVQAEYDVRIPAEQQQSSAVLWIILAVVVVGALFWWRRKKSKKK